MFFGYNLMTKDNHGKDNHGKDNTGVGWAW